MLDDESSLFGSDEEDDDRKRENPEDKKWLFRKELRTMIYGFGDDKVSKDYFFFLTFFPVQLIHDMLFYLDVFFKFDFLDRI